MENPDAVLLENSESGNYPAVKFVLENCTGINVNTIQQWNGKTPLILASGNGHRKIVQLLLMKNGINVNKEENEGRTALYYASCKGHTPIVQLLLGEENIEVNKADTLNEETALHCAAKEGHTEVVELLLEKEDIDVNTNISSNTPLMRASAQNYHEIVQLLLKKSGIDINKADNYGNTALSYASYTGRVESVQLLLDEDEIDVNIANADGETPLWRASKNGHAKIVEMLLKQKGIFINKMSNGGETALWKAHSRNHIEVVELLLEHPKTNITMGMSGDAVAKVTQMVFYGDTTEERKEVFGAAISGNATQVSHFLHSNENSSDSFHSTLLFWASTRDQKDVVKVLLEDANILVNVGRSSGGANALYQASKYGLLDIVTILLKHPTTDANYATLDKRTSLMVASDYGHPEVVRELLSVINIDVNHATFDGKTALIYAVMSKQEEVLELLLRCPKTKTNLVDEEYMTALGRAKEMNSNSFKELFRDRGTLQISKGHTCCSNIINRGLHIAVQNGNFASIGTFLACPDIDINVHNKNGYTPLSLAIERGDIETVKILLGDRRIDVNKQNTRKKQNAIIIASEGYQVEIMKLLLLHDQTFVNQKNAIGQSALSVAQKNMFKSPIPTKHFPHCQAALKMS